MDWKGKGRGRQEFYSGLSMTILFTLLYFMVFHAWWVFFPLIFAGVMPMVRGLLKIIDDRARQRNIRKEKAVENANYPEKAILQAARNRQGKVTPTLIALDSNLSIEEAEKALRYMASHGYATMEVRDNGSIEYIFSDFLPQ